MTTVAITGASSGIGLRAARRLAEEGHHVLALCRNVERSRAALGDQVEIVETHMEDLDSVRGAAERAKQAGVEVLINNAAIFDMGLKQRTLSPQGHELVWATNHLGPSALAEELIDTLAAAPDGRVVFIASKGLVAMPRIRIRWDRLDGEGWYTPTRAYYHAKLAQVMTAQTLHERHGDAVAVSCLRVPAVRLDPAKLAAQPRLQRALYAPKNRAAAAPAQVADAYVRLAVGPEPDAVYVDERGAACPLPRFARDRANRERLAAATRAAIAPETGAVG